MTVKKNHTQSFLDNYFLMLQQKVNEVFTTCSNCVSGVCKTFLSEHKCMNKETSLLLKSSLYINRWARAFFRDEKTQLGNGLPLF